MKMDQPTLGYILNAVQTANLVKIDSLIIEPGKVRAIDEERTVFILQDANVPDLPFGSIGLNRLGVFSSRLDLVKLHDTFDIDVTTEGDSSLFARTLTMKAKGLKVDYRCANPATIQAPKAMNDAVKIKVTAVPEAITYMQKGASAMGADVITLIGNDDGVTMELADINMDKMTFQLADAADLQALDGSTPNFTHKYPIKTVLALFKHNTGGAFQLTSRGIMRMSINNLCVNVLPKV
jgi:hypothetical protein